MGTVELAKAIHPDENPKVVHYQGHEAELCVLYPDVLQTSIYYFR